MKELLKLSNFKLTKEECIKALEEMETIYYDNDVTSLDEPYTGIFNLTDLRTTLETCNEPYLCMSFGDGAAMVISRGSVKNVVPEVKLV